MVQRFEGRVSVVTFCASGIGLSSSRPLARACARYVSPNMYQTWNCGQLLDEKTRLTSEVQRVSELQRENANADAAMMAVGLVVFWPALIGLAATKDRKDELGRLKGEYEAVDLSVKTRQCTLPPPAAASAPEPLAASVDGTYRGKASTDSRVPQVAAARN